MIETVNIPFAGRHLGPDEALSEPVPMGQGRRDLYALIVVGHGSGSYNFGIRIPKTGMPNMIKLGDKLLQFVDVDRSHFSGPMYKYRELPLEAFVVPDDTAITYPERSGPRKTVSEMRDDPERIQAA